MARKKELEGKGTGTAQRSCERWSKPASTAYIALVALSGARGYASPDASSGGSESESEVILGSDPDQPAFT